jgi:hypothetical protein
MNYLMSHYCKAYSLMQTFAQIFFAIPRLMLMALLDTALLNQQDLRGNQQGGQ